MSYGTPPADPRKRLEWLAEQSRAKREQIETHRHPDRAASVHLRRIRTADLEAARREALAVNRLSNLLRILEGRLARLRPALESAAAIRERVLAAPEAAFGGHRGTREQALELIDKGMRRDDAIPRVLHEAATQVLGADYFGRLHARLLLIDEIERAEAERSRVVEEIEALEVAVPLSWSDPATPGDSPLAEQARA